jgi:hypothetical protein
MSPGSTSTGTRRTPPSSKPGQTGVALVGEGTAGVGERLEVRIAGVVEVAIPVLLPDDEDRAARRVLPAHDQVKTQRPPTEVGILFQAVVVDELI